MLPATASVSFAAPTASFDDVSRIKLYRRQTYSTEQQLSDVGNGGAHRVGEISHCDRIRIIYSLVAFAFVVGPIQLSQGC